MQCLKSSHTEYDAQDIPNVYLTTYKFPSSGKQRKGHNKDFMMHG